MRACSCTISLAVSQVTQEVDAVTCLPARTPTFEQELNNIIRRDHALQRALQTSERLGEQLLKSSHGEQQSIEKLTAELLDSETRCVGVMPGRVLH